MQDEAKENCPECGKPMGMYFKPLCMWCKPVPELRKTLYLGAAIEHLSKHHDFNPHEALRTFLKSDPNLCNGSFISIEWDDAEVEWWTEQHGGLYVRVLRLLTEAYPDPDILWLVAW